MSDEIEPCPWCGERRPKAVETLQALGRSSVAVACNACNARGPERDSWAEAVKAWNWHAKAAESRRCADRLVELTGELRASLQRTLDLIDGGEA